MAEERFRIESLDSVRGIASLIVVLNHYQTLLFPNAYDYWYFKWTPISSMINGSMAVIVFFVLSGFVLALPFLNQTAPNYSKFILRRFCRVYFPFFFSILCALLLWWVAASSKIHIPFYRDVWLHDMTIYDFFSHVFMFGTGHSDVLNPPMWTLIIEMRVSLVFPLLFFVTRFFGWLSLPIAVVAGYVCSKLYIDAGEGKGFYVAENALGAIYLTGFYFQFFVAGIFIALKRNFLIGLMNRLHIFLHLCVVMFFFFMPWVLIEKSFIISSLWKLLLASYIVLGCLSFPKLDRLMSIKPLFYIGQRSYSLYLVHAPIILALFYGFSDILPVAFIGALSAFSIIVGTLLFYRFIELPSMRLGYRLTGRS
ncbi:MAG: acyltransferase [Alphaproteobacteria bacterium]|nr:acyltransferase [Alphaproteobacteria bacterium]